MGRKLAQLLWAEFLLAITAFEFQLIKLKPMIG
jgi:hypothetical protein